mgnify:CR=1 FL=1
MEPMLRFKADDGSDFPAWEEKALSEIAARVTRKNKGNQTDIPLTISSLDGLVDQRDYFKKTVASKDMSGYFLLRNGEFAYNKSYSVGFDYGSIKRLDKYPCGALSTLYICFGLKPNVKVDSGYLAHYFDSQKWNPEVAAICAEGARNHGLLNVPTADFFDINIAVPSLPEQRKIADLLSAVDDVIAAQEVEVAAWEKRKKGVMQKLFSQEVRFKADDGSDFPDWEERTFADVFIKLRNNTLSRDCLNAESGQARNIHYGDVLVKYGFIVDIQNNQVPFVNSDVECKRWDRLKDGDIVIADTAEDDSVGKAVEVTNIGSEVVYSGLHTIACRPRESFARNYLGYYMNSDAYHDQLRPYMQGIKVTSVSKGNIALTRMSVPSLPEQRKIADCLTSLDDVIAKAKDELDAWRELKKGLLQQMFV